MEISSVGQGTSSVSSEYQAVLAKGAMEQSEDVITKLVESTGATTPRPTGHNLDVVA